MVFHSLHIVFINTDTLYNVTQYLRYGYLRYILHTSPPLVYLLPSFSRHNGAASPNPGVPTSPNVETRLVSHGIRCLVGSCVVVPSRAASNDSTGRAGAGETESQRELQDLHVCIVVTRVALRLEHSTSNLYDFYRITIFIMFVCGKEKRIALRLLQRPAILQTHGHTANIDTHIEGTDTHTSLQIPETRGH